MCGIVGVVSKTKDIHRLVREMNLTQTQRGPDDSGYFSHEITALGMTRLAIRDIDGGHQPMTIGSHTIVFNGEIFNSGPLRSELLSDELFCSSHSDTEVLLRLYIRYGVDAIRLLNGMFAFAVYDNTTKKLVLVRDRFGIKPLYYSFQDENFLFASTIDAIKKNLGKRLNLDNDSLSHFFSIGYIPSPLTIYKEVRKLNAGEYIEINSSTLEHCQKSWSTTLSERQIKPFNKDKLEACFSNAVERWSISDVPYCYLLSGGLDSTSLLSFDSSNELDAYTLGFPKPQELWDETDKAYEYARFFGSHLNRIEFDFSLEFIKECLTAYEQPFSDGFLTYPLFKELSKNYNVAISGTGGDELFGGYGRAALLRNKKIDFQTFKLDFFRKIYTDDPLKKIIFNQNKGKLTKNLSLDYLWNSFNRQYAKTNDLDLSVMLMQIETQLANDYLDYTDKFSMKFSVECRTPFLDVELFQYILSLSSEERVSDNLNKKLLQVISKSKTNIVPLAKKGLNPPISIYLRDKIKYSLSEIANKLEPYIKLGDIQDIDVTFMSGDNETLISRWRLLMFEQWLSINNDYIN